MPISHQSFFLVFFLAFIVSPLISAAELTVDSCPSKLLLPLGVTVEDSPGSRPGAALACNRVHIRGLSRLRHPEKFAHALKIRVNVSQVDALFRIQTIELCFHSNASIGVGMCPASEWQKLSKSSWVQSMSPYGYRILDIRMLPDPSRSIEVSTTEELLVHRVVFLVLGIVMMAMARVLSESVVFYYGGAMTIGIILVILMVLFQGMRLLPTGRKSSLAIFMYSSVVGLTTFLLHYLSGLLRSILVELGISEDMHNPLGIFLLVCLVLAGAWFGYWGVRKLVLTEEGIVDSGVAYFVEWAILILSAVMVLQSSLDTLFAIEALGFAILVVAITRKHGKARFFRRFYRRIIKSVKRHPKMPESPVPTGKYLRRPSCSTTILGLRKMASQNPDLDGDYYSTFHMTPERKRFSKEQWESFTKEQTKKSVKELMSSPDFQRWAIANSDRIVVTPPGNINGQRRQRLFQWF
ncbi:uncharacterized protein [Typha angustifolia]|uniref:uncharacterized protein n=1 Tax=Typha angustifolia TaxID=59011 RepID=UPI003C2CAEF4